MSLLHPSGKDTSAGEAPYAERTPTRDFASQSVAYDPDAGDDDDDESINEAANACCGFLRVELSAVFPKCFSPMLALFLVIIGLFIAIVTEEASENKPVTMSGVIIGIDVALLLGWIIVRLLVMFFMHRTLPEGNYWHGVILAVDPHVTYLLWSINCTTLWASLLQPVNLANQPVGIRDHFTLSFFVGDPNIAPYTREGRKYVLISHLTGLLWLLKDAIICLVMFYFLVGLYKNINPDVVDYLSLYSILRKLNLSCVRLKPIENVPILTAATSFCPEDSIASSAHALQRGSKKKKCSFLRMSKCYRVPEEKVAKTEGAGDLPPHDVDGELNAPRSGLFAAPSRQSILRPILGMASNASESGLLAEVGNLKHLFTRTGTTVVRDKKGEDRQFNVEMTGRGMPQILSHENVEATKKHSLQNLLAVKYVEAAPPVLFISGSPVELLRKSIAKEAAARLFDELISFRLSVAARYEPKTRVGALFPEEFPVRLESSSSVAVPTTVSSAVASPQLMQTDRQLAAAQLSPLQRQYQSPKLASADVLITTTPAPGMESSGEVHQVWLPPGTFPPAGGPIVSQSAESGELSQSEQNIISQSAALGALHVIYEETPTDRTYTLEHSVSPPPVAESGALFSSESFELYTGEEQFDPLELVSEESRTPVRTIQIARPYAQQLQSQPSVFEINIHPPSRFNQPTADPFRIDEWTYDDGPSPDLEANTSDAAPRTFKEDSQHRMQPPAEFSHSTTRQAFGFRPWVNHAHRHDPAQSVYQKTLRPLHDEDADCLTRDLIEIFLSSEETDIFFKLADHAGHGSITRQAFRRVLVQVYLKRKQMLAKCRSHDSIQGVMRNLVAVFVGMASLFVLLLVIGIEVNTLLISGAAIISSITVALSFIYSSFVQSVVFVAFYNPYNISDRVRIEGGDILIVKSITTFNTTFETLEGRPLMYSHTNLISKYIVNDSRSSNATLNIKVQVLDSTSSRNLDILQRSVESYCRTHKSEYVKDSYFFLLDSIEPGKFITLSFWMTLAESWHKWRFVWNQRTKVLMFILRKCEQLGITYKLPVQRFEASGHFIPQPYVAAGSGITNLAGRSGDNTVVAVDDSSLLTKRNFTKEDGTVMD